MLIFGFVKPTISNIPAKMLVTLLLAVFSYSLLIDFVSLINDSVKLELCESDMEESDESEKEEKEESKKEEKLRRSSLSLDVPLFSSGSQSISELKRKIQSPIISIKTPPPELNA